MENDLALRENQLGRVFFGPVPPWISYLCYVCSASAFMVLFSTSSVFFTSQYNTICSEETFWHTNGQFIIHVTSSVHLCCSLQPCRLWEEIQREAPVSSPSPSWGTPTRPVPHLDAAMARCGALAPRAMTMTANGVSVQTKV